MDKKVVLIPGYPGTRVVSSTCKTIRKFLQSDYEVPWSTGPKNSPEGYHNIGHVGADLIRYPGIYPFVPV
eukprot:2541394-Rhodomonas_salina.2